MSILGALKQQSGSIDELAKLPQAMIMQMAQRKEIGPELVAPILARKAQMADAVARTKTLQKGAGPAPTVMEQLMQKTADAEQPAPQAYETGIAQLPVEEPQYAGGGIVAFANNKDQPVDADMPREGESENDYLNRVRAVQEAGSQFFNPSNYNPINKLGDLYNTYIGEPFARGVKSFVNEAPEAQAARFNVASNARKNVSLTNAEPNTRTINNTPTQAEIDAIRATNTAPAQTQPGIKSLTAPKAPAGEPKAQSPVQKATGAPETQEATVNPLDAMLAKYEKLLAGDPEAAAKAKKEAMWSRLAEAGLNIMGGTSSNFAQNIALASPAVKGYGEDVKGIRAEEAAKMQQLMGLGLKGEALKQEAKKLGITEKHFDQMHKAQMAQVGEMGASRRDTANLRADTALENRIATMYKAMKDRPDNATLTDEQIYAKAKQMVTGQSTQNQYAGFSGRPLK